MYAVISIHGGSDLYTYACGTTDVFLCHWKASVNGQDISRMETPACCLTNSIHLQWPTGIEFITEKIESKLDHERLRQGRIQKI